MTTRREWQDKWIAALRSRKYHQATNMLKDEKGCMCCLGVAKRIYQGKHAFDAYDAHDDEDNQRCENLGNDLDVMQAFGFADEDGDFLSPVKFKIGDREARITSFVSANDHHGLSFAEIADLAEQHRDKVFLPESK